LATQECPAILDKKPNSQSGPFDHGAKVASLANDFIDWIETPDPPRRQCPVSGRQFRESYDSFVSVGVLQGCSPIASSLLESFPGAVRCRLPPLLPTSRATPENSCSHAPHPATCRHLSLGGPLRGMGWRRVRQVRRVLRKL
jgi:hypothetical protein